MEEAAMAPAEEPQRQLNRFAEYLWVCGGSTASGPTATVWAWDGQVDFKTHKGKTTKEARFLQLPSIANHLGNARARTGAAACVMKDRIYCLGGFSNEFGALQSVVSLNKHSKPQERHWRKEGSMIARRDGVASCAYEDSQGFGALIAIGGANGSGILNSCEQAMPNAFLAVARSLPPSFSSLHVPPSSPFLFPPRPPSTLPLPSQHP
jgi:hypothetical protein